jgi:L-asparaginase / beta-aspartyl-peptidase
VSAPGWSVILHGGARTIAPSEEAANRSGALKALNAAVETLQNGGSALDACEAAVRVLEDDPIFNAGTGAARNKAGEVELDAAIMDGQTLDIGAVGALKDVANPIRVARLLLREEATLVVGEGARVLAAAHGLLGAKIEGQVASSKDTVGAIVRDSAGRFAVAISTGGLGGALPGRIGDSPLPGCGFYADDEAGAVCFSGDGERISRTLLAARVIAALERGEDAQGAAELSLECLARVGGEAGAIVIGKDGAPGWAHNSDHFTVAMQTASSGPQVFLKR